jgi:hypothetical protein
MTRRTFLVKAAGAAAAAGLGGYSYWEAGELEPRLLSVPIGGLPAGFDGCRIALLADLHHGWFISRAYLASAVRLANSLEPDLVFLLGDYVDSDATYIGPVMEEVAKLHAPLGVYAVQGNRDIRTNRILTTKELARQKIPELTNAGRWIERNGSRIWICGFDDSTTGHPDVALALSPAPHDAVAIAMTHNPDLTQSLDDPRVRLVCCGHTHGGQVDLPFIGRPFIPSAYGQKYALGLVQAPHTKTFVTTGVGSIFPPLRFRCPPEVALLTLVKA